MKTSELDVEEVMVPSSECEQSIDLAMELVWAQIRLQLQDMKEVAARFHEGAFRAGLETAIEELECRLELNTPAAPPTPEKERSAQ